LGSISGAGVAVRRAPQSPQSDPRSQDLVRVGVRFRARVRARVRVRLWVLARAWLECGLRLGLGLRFGA